MSSTTAEDADSPWHAGEVQLQRAAGVVERMHEAGRHVIREFMPDQHRAFFSRLPFIVLGAVDCSGDVWATVLAGTPGFLQSPTERVLRVGAALDASDPAAACFEDGAAIGLLGIELHTRRRNRLNGTLTGTTAAGFAVAVKQSFGNCPQYIQLRDFEFVREPASSPASEAVHLEQMSERVRTIISNADTFFVASYVDDDGRRQVDVSHRGGKAGFVRIGEDGLLTIPDFAGNMFFATLGNFVINPRAGLVFVDFETGDLVQLAGEARVDLQSPEIAAFQAAERLWYFKPRQIVFRAGALPLRWIFQANGWSPNSLMTGSWDQAASRLKARELAHAWRLLRVTKIVDESSVIRSFYLEPTDDAGLMPYAAGQHLPIRVTLPGDSKPVIRTYTLSSAPADAQYRISVRRQGPVSGFLHETVHIGSVIETRAPAGQFTVDALESRPVVLLAAGVGVTPMLAMLRHIVYEGLRKRRVRPTWFYHSARALPERAFTTEIDQLAASAKGAVHVVRTLTDTAGATTGTDFDYAGRLDVAHLCDTLPFNDYDFYMCGPAGFMQSLYDGLRKLNVADTRIHAEAFGPSALQRRKDANVAPEIVRLPADEPTPVVFVSSGVDAQWSPQSGSLLDLAQARGLSPEFGCRGGSCGTCRTRIVEGTVAYPVPPEFKPADDEVLICCAVPAKGEGGKPDRLLLEL